MLIPSDFNVRAIRVSECMLNAAEDLVSNQPGDKNVTGNHVVKLSPSYCIRKENNEIMLFSSITRYVLWITESGYDFLMNHENETEESVINSFLDERDADVVKKFFEELNHYGVLSAA